MPERVCLIVPCYNEAARLDLARFEDAAARGTVSFVFVDDGSTDGTGDMLRARATDRMHVMSLERNAGKAEAVRQGMLRAAGLPGYAHLDWIGFWDADLSTPLAEVALLTAFPAFCGVDADAVIGSRVLRLGSRVRRRPIRHVLGRLFATASTLLLRTGAYDTQCGAKLFRPAVAARCFAEPFVTRWIFDVEILIRLNDAVILECPLREWVDVGGSKIRLLPNVWRTLRDLARLRTTYPPR
jgi:dolichyl-phosphate beta-glucosyltransferase